MKYMFEWLQILPLPFVHAQISFWRFITDLIQRFFATNLAIWHIYAIGNIPGVNIAMDILGDKHRKW